ncbi:MAG: heparin lyase I family protein [Anaerolineae bacterium]|nr:heparin lyase I family protein [Anaerolineae bacterium]
MLTGCTVGALPYSDSFEEGAINRSFWTTAWWVKRSGGIDDTRAFDGTQSLRAVINAGDRRLYGKSGQATERSELLERRRHPLGEDLWYSFAVYVPDDFPIRDVRLVMGQWKQTTWKLWLKHSPAAAFRFRNGVFSVTVNHDAGQQTLFQVGSADVPALVGMWTEFTVHQRFAADESGLLQVWMNGDPVVDYRGPLGYAQDGRTSYFRLGLYRDTLEEPMTMYFDDVRVWIGEQEPVESGAE